MLVPHQCPHARCTFTGYPAEMFEHFARGWVNFDAHGETSSAAKQVALAIGIDAKEYEGGFRKRAGEFTAGGLRVAVRDARVAPAATPGRSRRWLKSSAHRIYIECPVCPGVLVSAGRLHQHKHRNRATETDEQAAKILRARYRDNATCWFCAALVAYVDGQPGVAQRRLQISYIAGMASLHRAA